ncbi:MAG: hypothetical protein JJU29_20580 [Verrucomicrobia bacterium]|nr:hypothetical protein [Verrucomicrobiota bacterium]MCH8512677.1 hypothetical protein [Kiritimatiellia bacterium]
MANYFQKTLLAFILATILLSGCSRQSFDYTSITGKLGHDRQNQLSYYFFKDNTNGNSAAVFYTGDWDLSQFQYTQTSTFNFTFETPESITTFEKLPFGVYLITSEFEIEILSTDLTYEKMVSWVKKVPLQIHPHAKIDWHEKINAFLTDE